LSFRLLYLSASLSLSLSLSLQKMENDSSYGDSWDSWVDEALAKLHSLKLLRSLRPINLSPQPHKNCEDDYQVFDEMQPWDRSSVEISISEPTFHKWLLDIPSSGILFFIS
jgi:8-amino-7-oxononanoate synthase